MTKPKDMERHFYEHRRVHGDLTSPWYRIGRALRAPQRIGIHLRRFIRSRVLRLRATSQEDQFRLYVDALAEKNPYRAVGPSSDRADWNRIGRLQFDYLRSHGLKPEHRLLDIGCGNLRGGRHMIAHLDASHYTGVDISREILIHALETIVEDGLAQKLPYLFVVKDMDFAFLPDRHFDVVHAHSVFSHCPAETIAKCLGEVRRLLKPGGFFDFTFLETSGPARDLYREDYYFPRAEIIAMAEAQGFEAEVMEDWNYVQTKVRVRPREDFRPAVSLLT